ncbi:MAG: DUF2007 domain-containing protein [Gammaproteobacteria bacterium]|nr:DUF2007 domain-containing protein [Gammaproteobacteria bacterium]
MKRLYVAAHLLDAQMLQDRMDAHGIHAEIFNANAQGVVGEIPFVNAYPEVWVADETDMVAARSIVEIFETPRPEKRPTQCPGCGESNPGNFEFCWHCGADLPD